MAARANFVFGYGSLVGAHARAITRTPRAGGYITELRGFRRCWGVAMDNRHDLPGYKYYLLPDGSRPPVFVAFLDLVSDPAASVNGVCAPVDADDLRRLDLRERNYARVEVSGAVEHPLGRVWTYIGTSDGRRRLRRGRENDCAVISAEYLARVEAGFSTLGPDERRLSAQSLDPAGLPVCELRRVDLP